MHRATTQTAAVLLSAAPDHNNVIQEPFRIAERGTGNAPDSGNAGCRIPFDHRPGGHHGVTDRNGLIRAAKISGSAAPRHDIANQ